MMPSHQSSNSAVRPGATRRATVTVTGPSPSGGGGEGWSATRDSRLTLPLATGPRTHLPARSGDDGHMPEGDTVWLAGRRLHEALAGRVLTRSDFRVPHLATTDLAGRRVTEVVSRGKHLLTRVGDDLTLHTHFRMDGSWHLYRPGDRWRGGPQWQVRVVLENPQWQAVGYRLPVVELLARDSEADAVGHLGPDILGPDWDLDEAVRRLARD